MTTCLCFAVAKSMGSDAWLYNFYFIYSVYIHKRVYIYTHIHTYIYIYNYICIQSHTYKYMYALFFANEIRMQAKEDWPDLPVLGSQSMKSSSSLEHSADETMSSVVWHVKERNEGKRTEKKNIRYLQVKRLLQRQLSILEKKCFRIVTFKTFKLYQAFWVCLCNCVPRGAGFPCQRNSASPELLNILGVRRCGVPAGLCRLAGAWHRTQYVQRATAPAWLGNASHSRSRRVRSEHTGLLNKYHYHIGPARRHLLWLSTRRVQAKHAFGKEKQVQDRLR